MKGDVTIGLKDEVLGFNGKRMRLTGIQIANRPYIISKIMYIYYIYIYIQ